MRLDPTDHSDQYKVWMTDDELEQLCRAASNDRDDLIIQLGGWVGLRSFEVPQVCPKHVKDTANNGHFLRIPEGKDTTGNGGKPRDAFLPEDVELALHRYQRSNNISPDEPYINVGQSAVRKIVKRTAHRTAEKTGEDDYQFVSSHDLRRRYAQRLLVDHNMNPRVVMEVGGWDSFSAIEPYLNAPTEDIIVKEFRNAGLA